MEAKVEWIHNGQLGRYQDSVYEGRVTFPRPVTDEEAFDYVSKRWFNGQLRKSGTEMAHPFEAKVEHWSGSSDFRSVYFSVRRVYCD